MRLFMQVVDIGAFFNLFEFGTVLIDAELLLDGFQHVQDLGDRFRRGH